MLTSATQSSAWKTIKDAITNYDKVIAAGKADAVIYNNRGKAKYNLQDYKGALPDFDKSLETETRQR
jgi:tetratricopeptide (TPR) repeat protein